MYAYVKLDGRDQIVIFAVLIQDVSMALVKKDQMEARYLGLVNAMKVTGIKILLLPLLFPSNANKLNLFPNHS